MEQLKAPPRINPFARGEVENEKSWSIVGALELEAIGGAALLFLRRRAVRYIISFVLTAGRVPSPDLFFLRSDLLLPSSVFKVRLECSRI